MIAIDTNILVPAHRKDAAGHVPARRALKQVAEQSDPWAIPWPCVHEFLSIVTHPKVFRPPSTLDEALSEVNAWCESPSLVLLSESAFHLEQLTAALRSGRVTGPRVHDARIAALCREHGVSELWTADRDFTRFPGLRVRNPLLV